jgi:hypothetical protein
MPARILRSNHPPYPCLSHKKCSNSYKESLIETYDIYMRSIKQTWNKPFYQRYAKMPKIPTEEKLNMLISKAERSARANPYTYTTPTQSLFNLSTFYPVTSKPHSNRQPLEPPKTFRNTTRLNSNFIFCLCTKDKHEYQ